MPEVPRFRALARAMYANSAGEMVRRLAEYLAAAMDAGELRRDDPRFAAEMLLQHAGRPRPHEAPVRRRPTRESEAQRTARIVDSFLRAFAK